MPSTVSLSQSTKDMAITLTLHVFFEFPKARTNYGKFNIRFLGPKVWNDIDESLKNLSYRGFSLYIILTVNKIK